MAYPSVSLPAADPAAVALPLVFHDQVATVDRDPGVLAARLAQHYALLDFGPRQGWERNFLHRSASAAAGDLVLTCGYTSPIQGVIGERPDVGAINICLAGRTVYEVEGREFTITPDSPIFFAPGQQYCYTVDHFSGLAFHLDLARLRSTAAAMAGLGVSERRFAADLEMVRVVTAKPSTSSPNASLVSLLRRAFSLLDDPALEASAYLQHLQVDDLIYRNLALLLFPRLAALISAPELPPASARQRLFEELVEWIDANLSSPIRLTDLERRSGYSRRHLQAAFQTRYGCGPIQWVRRRRLERARLALLQPDPGDTVASIAGRTGFRSLPAFSRDFRATFGLRPSDLLHEGRRLSP